MVGELQKLFPLHWKEVGREEPLKMDWGRYKGMDERGELVVVVGRAGARIVAYWTVVLSPFLHSASLRAAYTDLLFVEKPFRPKGTFFALQRKMEEILLSKGVALWFVGEKIVNPISGALRRAGFTPDELVYVKKLGT